MNEFHPSSAVLPSSPVLEVLHLEALVAVERHGRLRDAAASLNVTPSALSHRIAEAERRLGFPLYIRQRRRLEPTPAARHLGSAAASLLEGLARAEADSRRMTGVVRRVVRLAVDAYRSYHWLPDFVRFARREAPTVELQVSSTGSDRATSRVDGGTLDVAIAPGDRPSPHLEERFLFRDELVLITPVGHRLASQPVITAADIDGLEFITYTRIPEPDREFALLFRPSNTYPSWIETIELPEAIVEMVAAGLGTSILSRWAVENAVEAGRIAESRVGPDGIAIPWHAFNRPGDTDASTVAGLLARWCAEHGSLSATRVA